MKILLGILLGLSAISFGLAFAFFSPESTAHAIQLNENMGMHDSIEVVLNVGE